MQQQNITNNGIVGSNGTYIIPKQSFLSSRRV